jgi:hypothetical protein
MAFILSRSPYIISIDEAGQTETKIEIFLWLGTGSIPSSPTYTLSKLAPAPTSTKMYYNVSSYIREFLNFNTFQNVFDTVTAPYYVALNTSQYVNVRVKKYYKTTGSFIEISTTNDFAFDGYSLYTDGYNFASNLTRLTPKTYYYLYQNPNGSTQTFLNSNPNLRTGTVSFIATGTNLKLRWTNLRTNTVVTQDVTAAGNYVVPRVLLDNYADGNKFEIYQTSPTIVFFTATFKPKTECKYTPVVCDFINKWGAWQREYFFKASKNNIEVQNTEYNLLQSDLVNYSVLEGQRKTFNTNYLQKITVNTDWVSEDFSDNLQELMTSERILLDNRPVKLNTKSVELLKQINTKMINYTLEFEYATDIINIVI